MVNPLRQHKENKIDGDTDSRLKPKNNEIASVGGIAAY